MDYRPQDLRDSKLEPAPLGPWEFRTDTGLFEFNEDFYAIYGTTLEREGRFMTPEAYVREFVHPDDRQLVREVLTRSHQGRLAHIAEHRIVRRDGAVRTIRVSAIVSSCCAGDSRTVCGVNQDITEYKLMERELHATLGALPDLLLRVDARGKLFDCRIPEQYAAYLITDAACDTVETLLPAPLAQTVKELAGSSLLQGKTRTANYSGQLGAAACAFEIRTAPIGDDQVLVLLRDQTELYRAQREVQRLDSLNLIGEMAASIGHEIRNPLTTVRGYLQFLSAKEPFNTRDDMFRVMIAELDRTNAIISQFLALAKNKAVNMETKNLNAIIAAIYPLLEVDAAAGNKTILLDLEPGLPDTRLDESEFRQLLINLVRNGLEAMADNGCLKISTAGDGEHAILAIRDQGPGIPDNVVAQIGTPFVTTKENGTGLGLSVCYSIAARHGALIDFVTGADGTEFVVRFQACLPR